MKSRANKPKKKPPRRKEIQLDELKAAVSRAKALGLDIKDFEVLDAAVETLAFLTAELEKKGASIKRLRKLLFGSSTEKTDQVLDDDQSDAPAQPDIGDEQGHDDPAKKGKIRTGPDPHNPAQQPANPQDAEPAKPPKKKRKGHGRNGAKAYVGAEKVELVRTEYRQVPQDTPTS